MYATIIIIINTELNLNNPPALNKTLKEELKKKKKDEIIQDKDPHI